MRRSVASLGSGRLSSGLLAALLASTALLSSVLPGRAQDSDWLSVPTSGNFNTGANWSPAAVPTGTAFFGASTTTNLSFSTTTTLDGWTFNSGASAYTFTNNQVLTFTGAGLTVNGGSVAIITNNGGTTAFTGNASGGTARFIVNTGGALDISGAAGSVAAGSIEGAGSVSLGANELEVGQNGLSTVFSGVIDGSNFSSLTKVGIGTLTLTGVSTHMGGINAVGGTLLVNGSIGSSGVIVGPGATLGGTGTVGFTFLDNEATLAPGTPTTIGTLTVNDQLMFPCACGTFAVKVSSTENDRVNVLAANGPGDAHLDGVVRVTSLNGSYRFNSPYTILTTAGALYGSQFSSLVLPAGLSGGLGYIGDNTVTLTLTTSLSQVPTLSGNQQRIANVLDAAFNAGGSTGAFSGVFGGDVNAKLGQLAGQPATGISQAGMQMTSSFLSMMLHPTGGATGSDATFGGAQGFAAEPQLSPETATAYAAVTPKDRRAVLPVEPRWSVWGQVYGGHRKADGDAATGAADTTTRTYGLATGFDYRAAPDTVVGLALAGGATSYGLADGLGGGKSEVFQLGLYGTRKFGAAYVSAALSYAWHDASTDRTVTVSGTDKLTADFSAHSFGGRLEGGYRFDAVLLSVTPYAAVQVQAFRTPSYSEAAVSGSNAFALSYDARTVNATRTELGLWFDKAVALDQGATLALRTRAAWAHDFNNDQSINAAFQTLPGASFTVNGAQAAPNAALLSAGAELRLVNNWSVAAKFDGEFASGARTYAGTGTVRYVW
ncbi:MAG: autotransporter protein [Xanthobacteraceae bacterium]|nr:autotransporter protein [Xanthobacteraceae bacterium]